MRSEHILDLIDGVGASRLSASDRARVDAHAAECAACERAFASALASEALLAARALEEFEPSPFFATRVMARVREQREQAVEGPFGAIGRLWRAAGALVTAMALSVFVLAGAAIVRETGGSSAASGELATAAAVGQTLYSDEWDLLEADPTASGDAEMSDDQVFALLEEGASDDR